MYYGSITDLQKDQGAENPDNHIIRDTADSETPMQWWANQKKYEDRVFLNKLLIQLLFLFKPLTSQDNLQLKSLRPQQLGLLDLQAHQK